MAYKFNPFTGKLDMVGITEGGADLDASNLTYETPGGDLVTVKDQLDDLYGKVFPINISSFKLNNSNSDITVETGRVYGVGDIVMEWALSSVPVEQTLSGNTDYTTDMTKRTAKNTAAVSTNTTYTLTVKDASGNTKSLSRKINFAYKRFAVCLDSNTTPGSFTAISSGAATALLTGVKDTVAYTPSGEQFLWYAIPQNLTTSPSWKLNAGSEVSGGMTKKGSMTIINEYGKQLVYDLYCSNNAQAGKVTLTLG